MKNLSIFSLRVAAVCAVMPVLTASAQIIFSQNFSSSAILTDYVGTGANQFDAISTSNATGFNWSLVSGAVSGTRTANAGAITRSTDLSISPNAVALQFDFNLVDATGLATTALSAYLGNAFTSANSAPANSVVHSRFGINFTDTATEAWGVRNIAASTSFGSTFTGTHKLTFVANNSGSNVSYNLGSGVVGSTADDTFDLWVDGTIAFDDSAATTAGLGPITDFKIVFDNGTGTATIDNVVVTTIVPEPTTAVTLVSGLGMLGILRRRRTA